MKRKQPAKKRSPLPQRSLPTPGESLRDHLMMRITDIVIWAMVPIAGAVVALLEWYRYWLDLPPSPITVTLTVLVMSAIAGWRIWRITREVRPLFLGVRGERFVGQKLEELRANGYRVFHDLQQDGFNIDHVLVGPAGVFAVETKAVSMPTGRRAEVHYDGERVLIDGREPERDPVKQAAAAAGRVAEILKRMTGHDVAVQAVVLYPAWWVESDPTADRVWVLNIARFFGFIRSRRRRLSDEDIALYADRIGLEARSLP